MNVEWTRADGWSNLCIAYSSLLRDHDWLTAINTDLQTTWLLTSLEKILDFLNQLTAVATWPRDSFCLKPSYDPGLPWVFWLLFICMAYLLICTGGEVALKKNSCRTLFLVETGPIMYAACCLARLPLWSRFLIEFPEVGLRILPLTIIWLLLPLIEVFTGFWEPSRWRMSLTIY